MFGYFLDLFDIFFEGFQASLFYYPSSKFLFSLRQKLYCYWEKLFFDVNILVIHSLMLQWLPLQKKIRKLWIDKNKALMQ